MPKLLLRLAHNILALLCPCWLLPPHPHILLVRPVFNVCGLVCLFVCLFQVPSVQTTRIDWSEANSKLLAASREGLGQAEQRRKDQERKCE